MRWTHPTIHRDKFVEAVRAEGVPIWGGYVKPIYMEPYYQKYPADCPVTEEMYYNQLMFTNICHAGTSVEDVNDFIEAVNKVYSNLDELKG